MQLSVELPRTVLHALRDQAATQGERPALWTKLDGRYQPTSWYEYQEKVRALASSLSELGFGKKDALAILSFNREEWLLAELAAMALGGFAVGLYLSSSAEQIRFVLQHARVKIVVVERPEHLQLIRSLRSQLSHITHVVLIDDASHSGPGIVSFQDLLRSGGALSSEQWNSWLSALQPSDVATLIYTSGTTGSPKGVMLTHRNICWTATQLTQSVEIDRNELLVSYLPLSHIAEQISSIYAPILHGMQVFFAQSLETIGEAIREVRPTIFFGVPRVWEKFKSRAEERISRESEKKQKLIAWARKTAEHYHRYSLRHLSIPLPLRAQYVAAQQAVFRPLKHRIGFDRTRIFITSAAPIGQDTLDFFCSLDIVLCEVYGQSEVTGPTSLNIPGATKLGTVGRPMLGVEVRLADDGEILVRGDNVCPGYFEDAAATAELLQDGWLHSGDVGELDDEGFLKITGRKKELIVTSGGKKTSPAHIETLLKAIPPIGNALVLGERRNYLVALLPLNAERVATFSKENGFSEDPSELSLDERFIRYLEERIESQVNAQLSRFEQIKRFEVRPVDFSVEAGELTPTLKVKRKVIEEKHAETIERLYSGASRTDPAHSIG